MAGDCDKDGHNWVYASETPTTVTHRCTRCPATNTRPKGKMSAADLVCLLAAVVILAVTLTPIWLVASTHP